MQARACSDSKPALDRLAALVRLTAGDQVVVDGKVVDEDGLALDESTLTGESEPLVREVGEQVWGQPPSRGDGAPSPQASE